MESPLTKSCGVTARYLAVAASNYNQLQEILENVPPFDAGQRLSADSAFILPLIVCETEQVAMTTEKTWVLITDGARARLVAAEGRGKGLQLIEKLELSADHSPNRELLDDKPARVFESHGPTRHGVEPKSDAHRELKRDFAKEVATVLDAKLSKHEFDKLVVVAAPVTLGDLRRVLSESVKAAVTAEVSKDLTKVPNSEIARHIEDLIRA